MRQKKTVRRSRSQRGGNPIWDNLKMAADIGMAVRAAMIAADSLSKDVVKANNFYVYCQKINLDRIPDPLKESFSRMMLRLGTNIANITANAISMKVSNAVLNCRNKDRAEYDRSVAELMNISINSKDGVPKPPPPPAGLFNKLKSWGSSVKDAGEGTGFIWLCEWYRNELHIDLTNLMSIVTMIIGTNVLTPTQSVSVPVVSDASVLVPPLSDQPPAVEIRSPSKTRDSKNPRTPSRTSRDSKNPRTPSRIGTGISRKARNRVKQSKAFSDSANSYNALQSATAGV